MVRSPLATPLFWATPAGASLRTVSGVMPVSSTLSLRRRDHRGRQAGSLSPGLPTGCELQQATDDVRANTALRTIPGDSRFCVDFRMLTDPGTRDLAQHDGRHPEIRENVILDLVLNAWGPLTSWLQAIVEALVLATPTEPEIWNVIQCRSNRHRTRAGGLFVAAVLDMVFNLRIFAQHMHGAVQSEGMRRMPWTTIQSMERRGMDRFAPHGHVGQRAGDSPWSSSGLAQRDVHAV